jgi:hypothetical protein
MAKVIVETEWDFGTDFASELLSDINTVSDRKAPFKIETEDYSVYWAGTVLRVDIKGKTLRGTDA